MEAAFYVRTVVFQIQSMLRVQFSHRQLSFIQVIENNIGERMTMVKQSIKPLISMTWMSGAYML